MIMGQELACLGLDQTGKKWYLDSRNALLRPLSLAMVNKIKRMLLTNFEARK